MGKSLFFYIALGVGFILITAPTQAGAETNPVANVVAVRGDVTAVDAAENLRTLSIKSAVFQDDTIRTGKSGKVQLLFTDNSIISLGRNSEMQIADYDWQPEKQSGSMKTVVKEGTFRVMGGAITKVAPQNFTTETPAATIGIRGSMYGGRVSGQSLAVVFLGGKGIDVMNATGSVPILKPGYGTVVKGPDDTPQRPVKFTAQDLDNVSDGLNGDAAVSEEDTGQTEEGAMETQQDEAAGSEGEAAGAPDGNDPALTENESLAGSDNSEASGGGGLQPLLTDPEPDTPPVFAPPVDPVLVELQPASTSVVPFDGVTGYSGALKGTANVNGIIEDISGELFMEVNWHSRKAFGAVFDPVDQTGQGKGAPVFFFGDIESNGGFSNVRIFGSGGSPDEMTIGMIEGTAVGSFFDDAKVVSLTGSGAEYDIRPPNQPLLSTWSVQSTAVQDAVQDPADITSPRGIEQWRGFVVGISEDMNNPDLNRRRFLSTNFTDFQLTVNKDTGVINGSLSASDLDSSSTITGMQVGGAYGSAYVLDDALAAILGCSGNCINGTTGLKPHGNYMVTNAPEKQFNEYTSWGYWEAAYEDSGKQYHAHVPGSMWIAGNPTPQAYIDGLISSYSQLTYRGGARATVFEPGKMMELFGSSEVTINFDPVASVPVTGQLQLGPDKSMVTDILNITSTTGAVSNTGFHAAISGATQTQVNGAYYGDKAQAVGGNFAGTIGTKRYSGIFSGTR